MAEQVRHNIGGPADGREIARALLNGDEPLALVVIVYPTADGDGMVMVDYGNPSTTCDVVMNAMHALVGTMIDMGHLHPSGGGHTKG